MQSWSTPSPALLPAQPDRLRLMDTASGALQHPGTSEEASLYVCGITPYDATHLGHANTYVSFDLLHRYWRACGYPVSYVQNVTDVDDPLLERAEATGMDWRELAQDQTQLFRTDMQALNVLAPDHYVGATETVDWVAETVTRLVENGTAYAVPGQGEDPDGDIYFDIAAAESATDWTLGSISGMSPEQMAEVFPERGGDPQRPGKRSPLDPLLWRAARPGEPSWPGGSLGEGRPGWHIECSAIARRLLPVPFSVQGGGSDLTFPHHEFSAAHATAVDGRPLAHTFLHAGMVALDGEKMSKSKGNLVLVSNLLREGADPAAIRTALLSQHYRADWEWTDQSLPDASARLERWRAALTEEQPGDGEQLLQSLHHALSHDLDAPAALVELDRWADGAQARDRQDSSPVSDAQLSVSTVVDSLLGIRLTD